MLFVVRALIPELAMKWRSLVAAAIIVSIVVIVGSVFWSHSGRLNAAASPPAIPVNSGVATRQDVPTIVSALGTVQPIETVSVQSRVNGQITKVFFAPGQNVKANEPLFLIDPRPYQAALLQAQGQLAHDQALLAQAQSDLARYEQLAKENSIAQQQAADQAFLVKQYQGTVKLDQAAVMTAQLNLSYCQITAPVAGLAGPLLVDPGNYVQTTSATALVTITQLQPIYVNFSIPETALDAVRRYQAQAPLEVDAYSQAGKKIATGKLTLISNQANMTTGTVMLQATFPNRDEALWPNVFTSIRLIEYVRRNAITVPDTAIMTGPTGPYVYVIQPDDTVKRAAVTVVARQNGIAVIGKGLTAGQRIVTNGQYRLADNVKVAIEPGVSGAPASGAAANGGATQSGG